MRRSPRSPRPLFRSAAWLSVVSALSLAAAPEAAAQIPQSQRESLAAKIDSVREDLDPTLIPDLAAAREDLQQAYDRLLAHLDATADPATRAGWLAYIDYAPLAEAMEKQASVAEQGQLAEQLYWRLVRNQAGLERQPLIDFREATKRFISAALFQDSERTVRTVSGQLGQIAELLRETEDPLTAEHTARINRVLEFATASRLAPALVEELRSTIGQNNVRVLVGRELITEIINRPVDRHTPSDECILGVRIIGQAHLNGALMADLLPSEETARLRLTLTARFDNFGTGYASPVRLRTHGFGNVSASRMLHIGDSGVAAEPVATYADLDSRILGIEHHLRIIRKIAARRAAEQKEEANRIAEMKLRARLAREFAQETDEQLASADLLPQGEAATIFRRLNLPQPTRHWSSSSDYLKLGMRIRANDQTSTAVAPPTPPLGHDLVVQVQESAVDNPASELLSGRALSDLELKAFLVGIFPDLRTDPAIRSDRVIADAANAEERAVLETVERARQAAEVARQAAETLVVDPVVIHFAPLRPVIFEARENTVRLGIRGSRFEQGDQVLDEALQITALYQPVRSPDGYVTLEREGEIQVEFPGGGDRRLSITQIALRRAVVGKLAEAFPEQLLHQPLELPAPTPTPTAGTVQVAQPARAPLRASSIASANGWVTVAFDSIESSLPKPRMLAQSAETR